MTHNQLRARNFHELGFTLMLVLGGIIALPMSIMLLLGIARSGVALVLTLFVGVALGALVDRHRRKVLVIALWAAWMYSLLWPLAVALATLGVLAMLPAKWRAVVVPLCTAVAFGLAVNELDLRDLFELWWLCVHPLAVLLYLNYFALAVEDIDDSRPDT